MLTWLLIITISFAIDFVISQKFEEIAQSKGYQGYLWWCFWCGIAGWIMVAALPDRNATTTVVQNTTVQMPDDDIPTL